MITLPYFCPHCHKHFEATLPCCAVDKSSVECPDCGGKAHLEKKLLFKNKKGGNYGKA